MVGGKNAGVSSASGDQRSRTSSLASSSSASASTSTSTAAPRGGGSDLSTVKSGRQILDEAQYEGYLTKRAIKSGRNWKKRYFVLTHTSLWYFKRKGNSKARGEFRLRPNTVIKDFDPNSSQGSALPGIGERGSKRGIGRLNPMSRSGAVAKKANCFEVRVPGRVLVLCAESVQMKSIWKEELERVIKKLDGYAENQMAKALGKAPAQQAPTASTKVAPHETAAENAGDEGPQKKELAEKRKSSRGGGFGGLVKKIMPHRKQPSIREMKIRERERAYKERVHSFTASSTKFEVDRRYGLIRPVGHGAYGVVIAATDTAGEEDVAIKKVTNAFEDLVDAKRILREIKLLRHFDHENIIHIKDILVPRSLSSFEDIYIVSELMETDLHRVIYSRQKLSEDHIQYFIYQVLRALKYIHSANVLHRDLKPGNLLLNSNCDLKVCDFGLARGLEDIEVELTEYVVTRWYRAPEIMLACREYTKAIDVWSVGCILAELFARKPLFPGEDYIHQLKLICDIVGTPSEADIQFVTSERAKRFMRKQPLKRRRPLAQMYPKILPEGIDLLQKLIVFNPEKRITVEEALAHPYLSALHCPEDEPVHDKMFAFDDNKPDDDLVKREIQEAVYREICEFHPEQRAYEETERTFPVDSLSGKSPETASITRHLDSIHLD